MMLHHDPFGHPERLIRRVYSYVAYRIGSGPDAEDVTSEVFERALRYRSGYDRSKGEPIAWLLGIARRCVDAALAAGSESGGDVPDRPADGDLEQETAERLTLAAAVSRLDDRERELIALRYGADLTASRIAELLDMRPNAVEVALHRALARLRTFLTVTAADLTSSQEPVRVEPLAAISRHGTPDHPRGEPA